MSVRFDPPLCDRCGEPSIVQIVTVSFEGESPPDQFLCRAHAPQSRGEPPDDEGADFPI
jgi:hypothetical protein